MLAETLGFRPRNNPDKGRAYRREKAWKIRYGAIDEPNMGRRFEHYEPAKMIAYTFSTARGAAYDTAVDMSCFFLYLDRIVDDACWDQPAQARELLQNLVDVLNEDTEENLSIPVVAMFSDVWRASSRGMSWEWRHRAAKNWIDYLWANLTEVYQRHQRSTPAELASFLPNRRLSGGPLPTFDMYEPANGFEVPSCAYHNPHLAQILTLTCDLCVLGNDLASYRREDATRDPFNAVLILRDRKGLTLDEASQHVFDILVEKAGQYHLLKEYVPEVCRVLGLDKKATDAVQQWSRCLDDWNGGFFTWQFEQIRMAVY